MGSRLNIRNETFVAAENHEWLGSAHGTQECESITLDGAVFKAAFADGVVPSGVVVAKNVAGTKYVPFAGVSEVQTINLGSATAGTITIGFEGETTGAIAFDATAATVQAALEALSNVEPGEITVTGGPLPGTITLTFGGRYAGRDLAQVTVTPTGLTGGTVTVATTTQGSAGGDGVARGHLFTTTLVDSTYDTTGALFWHGRVIVAKLPANSGYDTSVKADLPGIRYV